MTESPTTGSAPTSRWQPLDSEQRRVLGVLIEKAKTTPAGYPMTVNAIVTGCNQKNNRGPLMNLEAFDVEKALEELRSMGAVEEIDWMGRANKYKHKAYEWLGVSKVEIAVMGELLLRGAQALGELRGRAARMEPIADLAALKPIVDGLVSRGLMVELTPAGRGQLISHNLYPAHELAQLKTRDPGHPARPESGGPTPQSFAGSSARSPVASEELSTLSEQIAELRADVARLQDRVTALETDDANGT